MNTTALKKQQVIDEQVHHIMKNFYYLTDVPVCFFDAADAIVGAFPHGHFLTDGAAVPVMLELVRSLEPFKTGQCCMKTQTSTVTLGRAFQFTLSPIYEEQVYVGAFVSGPTTTMNLPLVQCDTYTYLIPHTVYKPAPKDLYTANLIHTLVENAVLNFASSPTFVDSLSDMGLIVSTHAHLALIADLVLHAEKQEALALYNAYVLLKDEAFFLKQRLLTLETLISSKLYDDNGADKILVAKNHFYVQLMKATSYNCLAKIGEKILKVYSEYQHLKVLEGKSAPIRKAILYVKEHFKHPLTLADVADYAKLSSGYLSNLFSSEMDMTLTDYIRRTRIHYSKRLLAYTTLSIHDISKDAGFDNQHYFSTVFKTITGTTPKAYRLEHTRV